VQIDVVRNLPALPAAVLELLEMLDRESVEIGALASKIALDPALAAKTLRLANSSFYGMPRHVTSLAEAASVLGLRTIRAVVTTAALTGTFEAPVCDGFDFNTFWRHAVGVAVGARLVAAENAANADAAFTAGLLHDIGRLVLASLHPHRYAEVLAHGDANGIGLVERERSLLGIDHAAVGALVTDNWRLPRPIVDAIAGHHVPPSQGEGLALPDIVFVADRLMHAIEFGANGDGEPDISAQAWTGIPSERRLLVVAKTELQTRQICAALLN
jgi:putative nucleotidyltransferase with HDIG domain